MSDPEARLRDLLEGMAGEVDAPPTMPRPRLRRATRGAITTLVAAVAAVAVVAVGATVGIRAIGGNVQPRIPVTNPPSTTTQPPATGTVGKVFTAVAFVDPTLGWMADSDGIVATSDGGTTWTRQYDTKAAIDSFDFIDSMHGWAVAGDGLLRTTDGGTTWNEAVSPGGPLRLRSVNFVDANLGWGIGGNVTCCQLASDVLFRTEDGGQTWLAVRDRVDAACFADASTGYAISGGGGLTAREVLKTTDGGSTWQTVFQPSGEWDQAELVCPDATTAWVLLLGGGAAGSRDYAAFRTADNGSSWTAELTSPLESNDSAFNGVPAIDAYPGPFTAVSADDAVFFGYCPACEARSTVMRTTDGATWQRSKIDGFLPQQVSFADSSHGWLIGQAGFGGNDVLLATSDGGATWRPVYARTSGAG